MRKEHVGRKDCHVQGHRFESGLNKKLVEMVNASNFILKMP